MASNLLAGQRTPRRTRNLLAPAVTAIAIAVAAIARAAPAEPGSWAFAPGRDTYRSDALLDLRYLSERSAGAHGFIRRSPDGGDFGRDATGFLDKAGTVTLADVALTVGNDYATVMVVSMDDLPVRTSKKILVQVGTVARPAGWEDKPVTWSDKQAAYKGFEVVRYGKAPWMIVDNDLSVTLANANVTRARAVGPNGDARESVPLKRQANNVSFRMPRDTMYVVLH